MAITFGDHLIDSGYYDPTPEQESEKHSPLYCTWPEQGCFTNPHPDCPHCTTIPPLEDEP